MPKVRKPRRHTPGHTSAAGNVSNTFPNNTHENAPLANPFMLGADVTNRMLGANPAESEAQATPVEQAVQGVEGYTQPFKKKLTKKEKKSARHAKFMGRLMLPGSGAKFKKSIDNLQSLTDFLPSAVESVTAKTDNRGKNMTQHIRKEIATNEIEQFTNVLSHPAFRNNPLAALRAHLTNSQAQERETQKKLNKIAGVKKPKRKKTKKKTTKKTTKNSLH